MLNRDAELVLNGDNEWYISLCVNEKVGETYGFQAVIPNVIHMPRVIVSNLNYEVIMMKRLLLFGVVTAVLLVLASCGEETAPASDPEEVGGTLVETAETEPDSYVKLRDLDFDGAKTTMLVRSEFSYEFDVDTENGDVVNDAVYARNRMVEELFNIDLQYVSRSGSFSTKADFMAAYTNSIQANDRSYDLVAAAANYLLGLSAQGYFVNLNDTENVSIQSPWYSQGYIENLSIQDHIYLVAGSASLNLLENMCVMFFNQDLMRDLGHEAPYPDVRNGIWTFDKLNALVSTAYADLNGDAAVNEGDRIGYLTYNNMINAQLFGMGQRYIEKDNDGVLYFKTELTEHDINAYNLVESFMNDLDATYHYNDTANNALIATENIVRIWSAGQTLFMPQVLSTAASLRNDDFDFGVLPMPKYDEDQESYITFILENVTVMGIAPTADRELAGAVLEALSIAGYEDLSPIYYEIAMKEKYSRDADTREMLDIIRSSVSFEYPMITQFMPQCIQNKKPLASSFAAQAKTSSATFASIVEGWLALD